jgi:hypothetical protein
MKLLEIYAMTESGEITETQAADTLGLTPIQWKMRKAKWGHRLPLLFATLDKIAAGRITRSEACETLQVGVRDVNKLQRSWSVARPLADYRVSKAATEIKWELHKKAAVDVIAGTMDFIEGGERANISDRQMRREVSALLMKHFQMPYKDLKTLTDAKRRHLADYVEKEERIESQKARILNMIASRALSVQEEALNRVIAKEEMKKTLNKAKKQDGQAKRQ